MDFRDAASNSLLALFTVVLGALLAYFLLLRRSSSEQGKNVQSEGVGQKGSDVVDREVHRTRADVKPSVKSVRSERAAQEPPRQPDGNATKLVAAEKAALSKRVDRIGGGDLWLWRADAVRRITDVHLQPSSADKVRRRIWMFLDDRPRFVASGCADGQARIYDLRSSATRHLVSVRHDPGSRETINTLLLTPGPVLYTGTWDGKRHAWESWPSRPEKGTEIARGEQGVGHENLVTGFALNRDSCKLAVACTVGRTLLFQDKCPIKEVVLNEQDDLVELKEALKLGDYGELYLTRELSLAGGETVLNRWDELLAEASFEGKNSRRDVDKLPLPATLRFRFTGCLTKGHKKAWRKLEHDGAVRCLVLGTEGVHDFLYSGSRDRTIKKWAVSDGSLVHTYQGHTSVVRCVAVNRDYLASGSDDRSIRIWKKDAAEQLRSMLGHSDFVRAVSLCPNLTERLVSAGDDGKVILWDVTTGVRLLDFPHDCVVTSVLLNASILATGAEDARLRLWHVESATLEREMKHPGTVTALSWL